MSGIYIASRTRHADKWRVLRDAGAPLCMTWIDEAGAGETLDWPDLWRRCIAEAKDAYALILYREDAEPLKGALVEAGAALGAGKWVYAVGADDLNDYSFGHHPNVRHCPSVAEALFQAVGWLAPRERLEAAERGEA